MYVCVCVSYKDESKEKRRKGFKEKFWVKKSLEGLQRYGKTQAAGMGSIVL